MFIKAVDSIYGAFNQFLNTLQCEIKGIDRAFHTLHQVYCCKSSNTLLTVSLRKADIDFIISVKLCVFFHLARKYIVCRSINRQSKEHKLLKNFIIVNSFLEVCKVRTQRNRRQSCWESTYITCVVIFLNMLS